MKNKKLRQILAENMRTVCREFEVNTVELCKRSGASPSAINKLMSVDKQPKLETVEAAAEALGIESWMLFVNDLRANMIGDDRLHGMVRKFAKCSPELKDSIVDYVNKMSELNELRD